MQTIEKKFKTRWKKYLQVYRSTQFCIRKEKNKQTKYNTADQVAAMQHTTKFFLFRIIIDKRFFIQ